MSRTGGPLAQSGGGLEDVLRLLGRSSVRVTQEKYVSPGGDLYERFPGPLSTAADLSGDAAWEDHPFDGLVGDSCDQIEVRVVVQYAQPSGLGRCRDQ